MRKNLNYIIGIAFILIGLILKSLLNHNIEYWELTKYATILFLIFGISGLLFSVWDKLDKKPKKPFKKVPIKWLIHYLKNGATLIVVLIAVIGLEKTGESLNYKLREYYLSQETITTNGILEEYVRFYMPKVEDEDFYLVSFKIENEKVEKGLLVEYSEQDGKNNIGNITIENNTLSVGRMKGSQLNLVYSKKFPSFFKIIN